MFQRINFHDAIKVVHLDWLEPNNNESLEEYCYRFSNLIGNSELFSIAGLSFGGIIAIELTRYLNPEHVILLSSPGSRKELPTKYRLMGLLRLHKFVPTSFLKTPTPIVYWLFGAHKDQDKILLGQILKDTSPTFLKWALDKVLRWKRTEVPDHVFHIHGTKDRIIPYKATEVDIAIEGAGHFMVYTHAERVSEAINQRLGVG
jgi:hypothetical protein